jgi:hypothetical protein
LALRWPVAAKNSRDSCIRQDVRSLETWEAIAMTDPVTVLADFTALRAYATTPPSPAVLVEGAVSFNQGQDLFLLGPSGPSDNNGTVILDALSRTWYRADSTLVEPEWFGAAGDGSTNDTTAVQAAINYVAGLGGGSVKLRNRYLVDSLNVPGLVMLVGEGTSPLAQYAPFTDFYTFTSLIRLRVGASITVQNTGALQGLTIIRDGLPLILSAGGSSSTTINALIAAFSGVAIYCPFQEVMLKDLLLLGHLLGIEIGAGGTTGRCIIDNMWGDNGSGLYLSDALDLCRVSNVHLWPFLTNDACGASGYGDGNWRNGYGFYVTTRNDFSIFTNCFAYGYGGDGTFANWVFANADQIRVDNWGSDGLGDRTNVVGVRITGNTENVFLSNGQCQAGVGTAIYIDVSGAGAPATTYLSNNGISGLQAGVLLVNGNVLAVNNIFDGCDYAYRILTATSTSSMVNDLLDSISIAPYSIAAGSIPTVFINGWTLPFTYTPTISAPASPGASFSSVVGECRLSNSKKASVKIGFTVTSAGSGGGIITASTPATAQGATDQYFQGGLAGAGSLLASIPNGSSSVNIARYDNTTALITGASMTLTGTFDTV